MEILHRHKLTNPRYSFARFSKGGSDDSFDCSGMVWQCRCGKWMFDPDDSSLHRVEVEPIRKGRTK